MEREFSRVILDALPGLVWTARPDGHADFFNQRWLDYSGLSEEEAMGLGWQEVVHPEDLPQLLEYWSSRLVSREAGQAEARVRRFDGVYRWFQFRTNPMTDASGQLFDGAGSTPTLRIKRERSRNCCAARRFWRMVRSSAKPGVFFGVQRQVKSDGRTSFIAFSSLSRARLSRSSVSRAAFIPKTFGCSEDMVDRAPSGSGTEIRIPAADARRRDQTSSLCWSSDPRSRGQSRIYRHHSERDRTSACGASAEQSTIGARTCRARHVS